MLYEAINLGLIYLSAPVNMIVMGHVQVENEGSSGCPTLQGSSVLDAWLCMRTVSAPLVTDVGRHSSTVKHAPCFTRVPACNYQSGGERDVSDMLA